MGKGLEKFLNIMRLNDDDYDVDLEEEYEDEEDEEDEYEEEDEEDEEEEEEEPRSRGGFFSSRRKSAKKSRTSASRRRSYEEDSIEDEVEDEAVGGYASSYSQSAGSSTSRSSAAGSSSSSGTSRYSGRSSKIVPMKQPSARQLSMEITIQRPVVFDDSCQICDMLLEGKAAVVNLEGIDVETAQSIINFISGACYAMDGNIRKISGYIFVVAPSGIDISGDKDEILSGGDSSQIDMSAFRLNV